MTETKRTHPIPATDEQVRTLLERYKCPVPFHEVRTRFLGNIATPVVSASPLKVVEDLWGGELPAFDSIDAANELIGALVLGLWNSATGVTIILTTHYIEEAEEMADRIGVISKGEIILVEDKATLMNKLGKKQLTLHLQRRLDSIPDELAGNQLELSNDGNELVYTFDAQGDRTGIAALMRQLSELGIDFKDLQTSQSSLEEIFVSLVRSRP
jgi:hypothetical protein